MNKDEALRLALEALEANDLPLDEKTVSEWELKTDAAITAIKAALEAKDEPVAWDGYNLDDMCEAFNRVIEEHFHRKHPFHDPVNNDAMIALRTLRGFIPYMKRHTTPPQRKPLTDEEIMDALKLKSCDGYRATVRAIEAAHGIKGEA
jgi:hypothetical protein